MTEGRCIPLDTRKTLAEVERLMELRHQKIVKIRNFALVTLSILLLFFIATNLPL